MPAPEDTDSPKRRAILNAATDLFEARGYGAVSMDAIARAADVSKATLYAHFESKDRLFATIIRVACEENIAPEHGPHDDGAEPSGIEAALIAAGGRILRFFLRERTVALHRLVVADSKRFPELGRAFYENGPVAGRKYLAAWLVRQEGLDVPDPELAAIQFSDLLRSGLWLRATLGLGPAPEDADIDASVSAAVRTFLRAYGVERGMARR
jgi:TetR/AcrR family transcriptional repressor of mexJK operon